MKFLRHLPGQLKRHYEKVLLVLALFGLVAAVITLNSQKSAENDKIETYNKSIGKRKPKPLSQVDLTALATALQHSTNPTPLNFSPPHNLFNPVKWQKKPDGTIIKIETGKEVGPNAAQVTKITPLNLIISLDKPSGAGFLMSVTQEASTNVALRRKFQSYVTTNLTERTDRTKTFTVRDVKGTAEAPLVVLELSDGSAATVGLDTPLMRVDGYKADIAYRLENKNFPDRRVGDVLNLGSEDYNIVAINPNEVVVSARSNGKKITIRNNAAP